MTPSLKKPDINFALSLAITRSPVKARPIPPPTAWPLTPMTTGLSSPINGNNHVFSARKRRCTVQGSQLVESAFRSPPEQKVGPSAVKNTLLTSASLSARATASPNCFRNSGVSEFLFSGLFRQITSTAPIFDVFTNCLVNFFSANP